MLETEDTTKLSDISNISIRRDTILTSVGRGGDKIRSSYQNSLSRRLLRRRRKLWMKSSKRRRKRMIVTLKNWRFTWIV